MYCILRNNAGDHWLVCSDKHERTAPLLAMGEYVIVRNGLMTREEAVGIQTELALANSSDQSITLDCDPEEWDETLENHYPPVLLPAESKFKEPHVGTKVWYQGSPATVKEVEWSWKGTRVLLAFTGYEPKPNEWVPWERIEEREDFSKLKPLKPLPFVGMKVWYKCLAGTVKEVWHTTQVLLSFAGNLPNEWVMWEDCKERQEAKANLTHPVKPGQKIRITTSCWNYLDAPAGLNSSLEGKWAEGTIHTVEQVKQPPGARGYYLTTEYGGAIYFDECEPVEEESNDLMAARIEDEHGWGPKEEPKLTYHSKDRCSKGGRCKFVKGSKDPCIKCHITPAVMCFTTHWACEELQMPHRYDYLISNNCLNCGKRGQNRD